MARASSYPTAAALDGTEQILGTQNGATVNIDPDQIADFIDAPAATLSATRTLLAAISASAGDTRYLAEAGREGWFKFSTANLSAKVTVDTLQGVYVAPASDTDGSSGAWVRIIERGYNVRWFGTAGDDTTDDLPAFNAAFALSYANRLSGGYGAGGGPRVYVPSGKYFLNGTLEGNHTFIFEGDGQGIAGGAATQLRFPAATCGVKWNTATFGFIMRGFFIKGVKGSVNLLYPGIWSRAKGLIQDCFVTAFSGPLIYIDGQSGANNNSWRIDNVRLELGAHSAIFADGPDSNAGVATGVDIGAVDRYGIEDSSFLGNQWYFSNIDGPVMGAYITDPSGNAYGVFGGYTETGTPPGDLGAHGIGWGPQFAGTVNGAFISSANSDGGGQSSSTGFHTRQGDLARGTLEVFRAQYGAGGPNYGGSSYAKVIEAVYSDDGGATFPIGYQLRLAKAYAVMGTNNQITIQGQASVAAESYGRTNPIPYSTRIDKLWLGDNPNARSIDFGAAAPTSGEYAAGEMRVNNAPAVGGVWGWTTTTAGAVGSVAWAALTAYSKSDLRTNDTGKTYVCITAGTSAASGGPTGTSANITDGTVHWKYLAAYVTSPVGIVGVIQGTAQADTVAADLAALKVDFNALLAILRTAKLIAT